jgi:hypothetical protein
MPVTDSFITVVSGLPRSGTSMMMRMLESGGLAPMTDGVRSADDDNPKGYYEFEPVKRLSRDTSWLPDAYNKAVKAIYVHLYHLPPEHRYKILFLRRDFDEVIASQRVMIERRQEKSPLNDAQLVEVYTKQLRSLDAWVQSQKNIELRYLDYSRVINESEIMVQEITRFLGLALDTRAMIRAVDPSLHRQRSKVPEGQS